MRTFPRFQLFLFLFEFSHVPLVDLLQTRQISRKKWIEHASIFKWLVYQSKERRRTSWTYSSSNVSTVLDSIKAHHINEDVAFWCQDVMSNSHTMKGMARTRRECNHRCNFECQMNHPNNELEDRSRFAAEERLVRQVLFSTPDHDSRLVQHYRAGLLITGRSISESLG